MVIALCGYMGSGKSTLGKMLAKKLAFDFVDLDGYIEEKENMINEIHSNKKVYQKNKYLNMKTKLALNLIRDKAKLYAFLLSILDNKKNKKIK